MASASMLRRSITEVSRRLLALLEESVTPARAVQILVAEKVLPPQDSTGSAHPLSSAIDSIVAHQRGGSGFANAIATYVGVCEAQGRGESALRLLGRLRIRPSRGRTSLGLIAIEFALLVLVLLIHSIFVLPQFQAAFASVGTPMPAFTRWVFAVIGPASPFMYLVGIGLLVMLLWRLFPFALGPLIAPLDRLLFTLPLFGSVMRARNSDRLSGWLGFAAADQSSQLAAIEAARIWCRGDLLSRECAAIVRDVSAGRDLTACLAGARGFDDGFRGLVSIPDREESLAGLRGRWRVAGTLPEHASALAPAIAQIVLGIILACVVIAMYLPIFKLGTLM